jgi:hypothetical protein
MSDGFNIGFCLLSMILNEFNAFMSLSFRVQRFGDVRKECLQLLAILFSSPLLGTVHFVAWHDKTSCFRITDQMLTQFHQRGTSHLEHHSRDTNGRTAGGSSAHTNGGRELNHHALSTAAATCLALYL